MKLTTLQLTKAKLYELVTRAVNPSCFTHELSVYLKRTNAWPAMYMGASNDRQINDPRLTGWLSAAGAESDSLTIKAWRVKREEGTVQGVLTRLVVGATVRAQQPRNSVSACTVSAGIKAPSPHGASELWTYTVNEETTATPVRTAAGCCTAACVDWLDRIPEPSELETALWACVATVNQPRLIETTLRSLEEAAGAVPKLVESRAINDVRKGYKPHADRLLRNADEWIKDRIDREKITAAVVAYEMMRT